MHFIPVCLCCILSYLSAVSGERNTTNSTFDPSFKPTKVLMLKEVTANLTLQATYPSIFGSVRNGQQNRRTVLEFTEPTLYPRFPTGTTKMPKLKEPKKSKKAKKPKKTKKSKKTKKPKKTKKQKKSKDGVLVIIKPPIPVRLSPPKCSEGASCAGRCSDKREFQDTRSLRNPSCFCDPLCDAIFQDCCADYDQECNATLMGEKFPKSELDSRWKCLRVHDRLDEIWMVGSCRPDWTEDEVSKKCTDDRARNVPRISGQIPVIDKNNITFRNRYCALCNGVKDFTQWKFDVDCDVIPTSNYTELEWVTFLDHFCDKGSLAFHSTTQGIRHCYQIVTRCRYEHDKNVFKGCKTGPTGLVSHAASNLNFRNMDCLRCNFNSTDKSPSVDCGPELTITLSERKKVFSFSAIFSGSEIHSSERTPQCPKGHLFDKVSRNCQELLGMQDMNWGEVLQKYSISLQYEQVDDTCSFSFKIAGPEKNRLRFKYVLEKVLDVSLIERGWQFADFDIQIMESSSYLATFEVLGLRQNSTINSDDPLEYPKIDNIVFHSTYVDDKNDGICEYSLTKAVVRHMFCVENRTFSVNKDDFLENQTIFVKETKQNYSRGQYLVYNHGNETRIAICKDSKPVNCSYYYAVEKETGWKLFPNHSVYSNSTASWFHYGEYSIVNGTLWLCLTKDFFKIVNITWHSSTSVHDDILSYTTLVTLTISLTSLAVLLIIYSMFLPLRNLPGKNLMVLCGTLGLGQLLWLLQNVVSSWSSVVCKVVSVALQYFFLSSFCSSGSIAFHSFITFQAIAKGNLRKSAPGKSFLWYTMYSLGFPFVVVAICWLLNFYKLVSIEYAGRQGNCWIGDTRGLHIAFIGPMFCLLCLNFVLLFATLRVIYKCTKASQDIAEKSGATSKKHVAIYLRMSTMMGFTWLFGVFQLIFPELLVFRYFFVFFNGLQGFYIALAFLFTDSVKKMFSKRLSLRENTSFSMNFSGTKWVR